MISPNCADALPLAPVVAPSRPPSLARSAVIDNAKAIGIILVVLGHSAGLPAALSKCIFAFHMPLFFFLSGTLLTEAKSRLGISKFLRQRGRALFAPYTLFFVLSWCYWIATAQVGHRAAKFANVGWADPWRGYFTGLSGDLSIINPTLWFFPCLFFVMLYYQIARRYLSQGVCTLVFVLLSAAAVASSRLVNALAFRLPMGMDVACVATGFFAFGHQMREPVVVGMSHIRSSSRAAMLAIAVVGFLLAWPTNGSVDMQALGYGVSPVLFFSASLSGIAATVLVASLLPATALASWLSGNTMLIFPTHTLIFIFLSGMSQWLLRFSPQTQAGIGYALGSTLLALLCAIPTVALLRRPLDVLTRDAPVPRLDPEQKHRAKVAPATSVSQR